MGVKRQVAQQGEGNGTLTTGDSGPKAAHSCRLASGLLSPEYFILWQLRAAHRAGLPQLCAIHPFLTVCQSLVSKIHQAPTTSLALGTCLDVILNPRATALACRIVAREAGSKQANRGNVGVGSSLPAQERSSGSQTRSFVRTKGRGNSLS